MTRADLLEVVYRFYPRGLLEDDAAYLATEQYHRLVEASRRAFEDYPRWKAMVDRLADRLGSFRDHSLYLVAGGVGPAYSAEIYPRESDQPIGLHVSFIGPYYGIHRTGAPGERSAAIAIAKEIEATYPGYKPIPPHLGDQLLPDIARCGFMPGETIYTCLLSEVWTTTGPRPEPRPSR